jgi:hypothetical protein
MSGFHRKSGQRQKRNKCFQYLRELFLEFHDPPLKSLKDERETFSENDHGITAF